MSIFLTGASGFLGRHFLAKSIQSNLSVTAIFRATKESAKTLDSSIRFLDGDLTGNYAESLRDCDILVHMAAAGVTENQENWPICTKTNINDSLALFDQCVSCGIKKYLIIGSCFEYGYSNQNNLRSDSPLQPFNAYSATKAAYSLLATAKAYDHDLSVIIVRPFHLYGCGESPKRFWPQLVNCARSNEPFPMTYGDQVRDFTPVEIAAEKLVNLASSFECNNSRVQIYNIGTGNPKTLYDFAVEEWIKHNNSAPPNIIRGALKYRNNEVMSFVPHVSSLL